MSDSVSINGGSPSIISAIFAEEEENSNVLNDDEPYYWPNSDATTWTRSCEEEVIEPMSGKNFGKLPEWLKGTFLRNGPGSLKVGEYSYEHLFDSSGLLHKFEIKNGNVTYQRRFIQTDTYKRNQAAKRIILTEFGTKAIPDPCESIFRRITSIFNFTESLPDNSMISVYPLGDEFYTFAEAPFIHRINPETLATEDKICIFKHVRILHQTAHPHVDQDGTVYNVGLGMSLRGPVYNVISFPPRRVTTDENGEEKILSMFDQAKIVGSVSSRWTFNPSYMHSFGITDNYFIIVEQPLAVDLCTLVGSQLKNEPNITCLKWYEKENTLIYVISRKTGLIEKTFVAETFFYLHIINQFETEDGKYVVLDICCYKDAQMLNCMYIEAMKNMHKNPDYAKMFRGRPLRFILPMVKPSDETPVELNLIESDDNCKEDSKIDQEKSNEKVDNLLKKNATAHRLPDGKIFVTPELLCDLGCETPRINYDSNLGKNYRYFYAISSDVDLENPGTLIKVDTVTKTRKTWCEPNVYPSEPVFVPNPNGEKEDDGLVLSAIIWGQDRETEVGLLVLNAETFEEIARSTFETPGPVPKSLHGWFNLKK